jgi:hypothetical protein
LVRSAADPGGIAHQKVMEANCHADGAQSPEGA